MEQAVQQTEWRGKDASFLLIADNTPDMFILDEPTNNLDIESIEIITATIRNYAGTVIAISHDREFLKDTGIEREILLE